MAETILLALAEWSIRAVDHDLRAITFEVK